MPNYCDYEMKVDGRKEDIEEFIKIIKADYHIDENGKCNCDRHFWRVFEARVYEEEFECGDSYAIIGGYCAWSVKSCMCDGEHTYNNNHSDCGGTTLQRESKRLNLTIEVFSSECGNCFMEHYVYENGECLVEDCADYYEYTTDEFETVEEMNKEYGTHFTKEEFENNDYLSVGGFEWNYGEF